jgi:RNA polymerase sigma-70 factor, ECF subfamily
MDVDPTANPSPRDRDFEDVWRHHRAYLLGMASRLLGDPAEAEDVLQDAFGRLARVELDQIDDVRGWMAVVVRRQCLDRIRSAHNRREAAAGATFPDGYGSVQSDQVADPADRVTLDDQVQLALAVVLDRLTPAERTAFVLHDVFGFGFAAVSDMVGRTPAACRQLASRARRSIRTGAAPAQPDPEAARHRMVAERFIAVCAGGDLDELMAALDPDVVGEATMFGHGPLVAVRGRSDVASRIIRLFGPATDTLLIPLAIEQIPGMVAFAAGRLVAVIRFEEADGLVSHLNAFVVPPPRA